MNEEMGKGARQAINARKIIAKEKATLTKDILYYIHNEIKHGICTYSDAEQLAAYLYDLGYNRRVVVELLD